MYYIFCVFYTVFSPQILTVVCLKSSETNGTKQVEPLLPPDNSKAGDKVVVEGYENGTTDAVLNPKKKIWEKLQVKRNL